MTDAILAAQEEAELPSPEEVADLRQRVLAESSRRASGVDAGQINLPDLTPADLDRLEARSQTPIGRDEAGFDTTNIPYAGVGVEVSQILTQQQAAMAVRAGTATYEQQLAYAESAVDAKRDKTFMAGLEDTAADVFTLGVEMAGSVVAGSGTAAVGSRLLARAGLKLGEKATSTMLMRRATELGLLTSAREGVPRALGHEGGAWTANSLRRVLPDMDISDEDAESLAAMSEAQFADVFLGRAFESNSIYRGLAEDVMSAALERAVGPAFARMTANSALKGLQGRVMQKLGAGQSASGLAARMQDMTAVSGGLNEVVEEVVQGMAVEQSFGDNFLDGIPDTWQELAQIALVGSVPGSVGSAIEGIQNKRRANLKAAALQEATPGVNEPGGAETSEGGDASAPVEATAATAGVEPGVSIDDFEKGDGALGVGEEIAIDVDGAPKVGFIRETMNVDGEVAASVEYQDGTTDTISLADALTRKDRSRVSLDPQAVRSFAEAAGIKNPKLMSQPQTEKQAEAAQMAALLGRDVALVSGEGGGRVSGMIDDQGRMFVDANNADPLGVAMHEMGHDLADTLGEETFRAEMAEVDKIVPGIVGRYRDRWLRRNQQAQAQGEFAPDGTRASSESGLGPRPQVSNQGVGSVASQRLETGVPVELPFIRNTDSATDIFGVPDKDASFDRYFEPSGEYVSPVDQAPSVSAPFVSGVISAQNPLVLNVGEYGDASSWKRALSNSFDGLRGKDLSRAVIDAGYDAIITVNKRGEPSEAVNLQTFDYGKARFAGKDAPSATNPTEQLATEEGFASIAEEYAALISYASTADGRKDMQAVAEYSPSIFRRVVDTVRRFVRKVAPDSAVAALDRIEQATRQRPDQAAAKLSLYLADLYKRGFGVQEGKGAEGASGTLLERLQAEAQARGLPVVKPAPAPAAATGTAGTAGTNAGTNAGTEVGQGAQSATEAPAAAPTSEPAPSQAVPVGEPSPAINPDAVPRPDLNNPLSSPEQRAVLDEVDRQRNAEGLPAPQSRKEMRDFAKEQLQRDYDGTRFEIEAKIETGERLHPWEVHALIDIVDALTLAGFRGDKNAFSDAVRLGNAYREIRSEAGRDLSSIVGRGRSAKDAVVDMMLMATRSNRRKRAKIQKEVDGIMRLVSPFKNQRARYLRTHHQMEQERKGNRFAPNRELKFAPGLLDERGKPVTEARLEYLQSQLEKIEADEAARVKRAGEAVAAQGFDLDALDMETLLDPYDGWRIRNAISMAKATKTDKFLELRYMNMLSGLATHARNTAGNAAMLVLDGPVLKTAEATAQMVLRGIDAAGKTQLADPEGATYTEVLHWFKGFANAMQPAFRNMLKAYRTQGPAFEMDLQASGTEMGIYAYDFGSKLDFVPGPKIAGKPAKVLRHLSLNTLMASDEYFKTLMAVSEVQSLAFRQAASEGLKGDARSQRMQELIDDRGSEIWTQGLYKAREGTFQDEGGLATQKTAKAIQSIVGGLDDVFETYAKTPLGTILIPFRKTPLRIAGRALRLTPLQTAMLPARAIAGEYKGNQAALVRDLADAMMAWGLTFAIMELVDMEDDEGRPFITGPRSSNRAESSLDYATNFPMSILVDGTYYDYSRFEPAATGLGMLVGVAEEFKRTGAPESLSAMLQSAVAQTKDKTFLRTIGDIMDLADSTRSGKDRTLGFLRDTFVTPMVPNIIRQTARESDDVLRERRTTDGGQAAFWLDGIYATAEDSLAKLTGAEAKEPRYTAWGEPIKRPFAKKGGTDTLLRLLSPIQPKLDTKDTSRLDLALLTWERKVSSGEVEDAKVYYPGRPSSSFKIDGEDYTMTPNEYARYVRTSGKAAAQRIMGDSGINLDDPSEKDIDRIRKAVNKERAAFRKKLEKERRALNTQ